MKLSERLATIEQPAAPAATSRRRTAPMTAATPGRKRRDVATWEASKRAVRELVLDELAPRMGSLTGDALAAEVRSLLDEIVRRESVVVSPRERQQLVDEVLHDTLGYGVLDPLLQDPTVTEIMCNAFDEVWVERSGRIEAVDVTFDTTVEYRRVIERIVSGVGRRIDEGSPMVDARLPDGSRVNAVLPPLATRAPTLTIRKFGASPLRVQDLINLGTITMDFAMLLEANVRGRVNVLLSGGTGTGKTTMLNVLSSFIPDDERIITIEDTAELQLQQPHVVGLEARPANTEGAGAVTVRDLLRNALRMRPNRIIVGECRSAEALDMLQAMNTGHEGSMTTVHANSPWDALRRLETMVLMAGVDLPLRAIREQLASGIHMIVQLERLPSGRRIVSEVVEVQGLEGDTILLQTLFGRAPDDTLAATGLRPSNLDRLASEGIEVPARMFRPAPPTSTTANTRDRRVPNANELAAPERSK